MEPRPGPGQPSTPRRLLIVDDEEKICRTLADYFSLKGYEVRAVQRGEEALALADVFQPQVVVLDLLMPGLSGIDTLKTLKQRQPAPKVVILSAVDLDEVVQGAMKLGADFYVCKPVNLAQLESFINGFSGPILPHPRH